MEEESDDGMETLIRFGTIGEARVAAGLLEAAGIDALVPDEMTAGVVPHLSNAMGGYRLQVARSQVERAREVLAADDDEAEEPSPDPESADPDDPRPGPREAAALRAWRAAIIGLVLVPVLLHLYSLWQLSRVLSQSGTLSDAGRRRAIAAFVLDVLVVFVATAILMRLR